MKRDLFTDLSYHKNELRVHAGKSPNLSWIITKLKDENIKLFVEIIDKLQKQ